jgi:hypothetical protein
MENNTHPQPEPPQPEQKRYRYVCAWCGRDLGLSLLAQREADRLLESIGVAVVETER